jgi:hypothetical protein
MYKIQPFPPKKEGAYVVSVSTANEGKGTFHMYPKEFQKYTLRRSMSYYFSIFNLDDYLQTNISKIFLSTR